MNTDTDADRDRDRNHDSVDLVAGDVVRQLARAALLAALMGAAAHLSVPVWGIPMTLQLLVVFLAGIYLGPYWGAASIGLYLAAGAVGAPVFSGGSSGLGVLVGPTGGFLWAFPVAALLIGFAVHRGGDLRNPAAVSVPFLAATLLVATAFVYVAGVSWYASVVELPLLEGAIALAPILPIDLLKVAVAVAVVRAERIDVV